MLTYNNGPLPSLDGFMNKISDFLLELLSPSVLFAFTTHIRRKNIIPIIVFRQMKKFDRKVYHRSIMIFVKCIKREVYSDIEYTPLNRNNTFIAIRSSLFLFILYSCYNLTLKHNHEHAL